MKTALAAVIVTKEPGKPLSAMDTNELEEHYARCLQPQPDTEHLTLTLTRPPSIIELLSASDMMVTSSLVALEGLEEKECEEAAGALVGYFDEHEAKPPEPVIRGTLTAIPLAGEPPSPSRHRGPRGARERAVGRSFRRA